MRNSIYAAILTTLLILAIAGSAMCTPPDRVATQEEQNAIDAIQKAIDKKGFSWTAGVTSVSNLSSEDKKKLCGAKPDKYPKVKKSKKSDIIGTYPESFDWRNKDGHDWMTSVKSQGSSCGSCWAFSTIGVLESAINIYANDPDIDIDLSEQHLVSDCYDDPIGYSDCEGGYPHLAMQYIMEHGVPEESCFPYIRSNCACIPCEGWQSRAWFISRMSYASADTESYKAALQEYGPHSVTLTAPDDWFYYTGGVYQATDAPTGEGHAVVLVGWDDSESCWIIKNSWGSGWGEDGYGRVLYGDLEKYGRAYGVRGITNYVPFAEASAIPTSGTAPLNVAFTGTGSDSDGTVVSYEWTFGDGASSTSQNPTHTYNSPGTYTATLTVTDNDGAIGSDSLTLAVRYPRMEGDVTQDGHVTEEDATAIAYHVMSITILDADQLICADTTDEGSVTITDAMHIAQWVLDPDGSLGILFKPLWESPADDDLLHPVP